MWQVVVFLACWFALIALVIWSFTTINYRVTTRFLLVTWIGIPVRWIPLTSIKGIATQSRRLLIHRRSGWFRNVIITPKNTYAMKVELERAWRNAMPPRSPRPAGTPPGPRSAQEVPASNETVDPASIPPSSSGPTN